MPAVTPFRILSAQNIVGECVLWDSRHGELWWTDIQSSQLHRYDWAGERLEVYSTPERVGSFGFVAGDERLVTAFASGVALYDVDGGTVDWIARPQEIVEGVRFNDGRVDRRGRFWAGSMVEGPQKSADGCLYSIGRGGSVRRQEQGLRISNGLCMSPDGSKLYFADSPLRIRHRERQSAGVLAKGKQNLLSRGAPRVGAGSAKHRPGCADCRAAG